MLRHDSVIALIESLDADDMGCLFVSHFNEVWLYIVTTEELSILIRIADSFVENSLLSSVVLELIFSDIVKTLLDELKAVIFDLQKVWHGDLLRFEHFNNLYMIITQPVLHTTTCSKHLHNNGSKDSSGAWKVPSEGHLRSIL